MRKSLVNHFCQWRNQTLLQLVEWTKQYYTRWFKHHRIAWGLDIAQLKAYPKGSLGHELGHFLEQKGFDVMPKLEDHDVMHVLMKFNTTVIDEARMQFFLLGNGKRSLYALFTAVVSLLLIPEAAFLYFKSFKEGKRCLNISQWNFHPFAQ